MISDQQEEDLLRNYLDHMVELYLQLRVSQPADAVRDLARALTFTSQHRSGADRKGVAVGFLHDADLLAVIQPIVILSEADLFGANLGRALVTQQQLDQVSHAQVHLYPMG